MSNNFKVEIKGLTELLELEEKIVSSKRKKLGALVLRRAQDIRTNAINKLRDLKAWNTGHLAGSILVEMTESKLAAEIGPTVDYGAYVEFGTYLRSPLMAALEDWANKHGIPVFLVCRAIARRGTFARPYLAPSIRCRDRLFRR